VRIREAGVTSSLALVLALTSGCTFLQHYEAANRSTDQFIQSTFDPRIYYEPGREEMARVAAASMSEAVATV
jgi:hypothetical protein